MEKDGELALVRRAYARRVLEIAGVTDAAVEDAFAAVRREDFLGAGPWPILRLGPPPAYVLTPDANPKHIYTNDLVGLIPERQLNNGLPSFHASLIHQAAPRTGEHAVHIGAGVGYYTAILAHMVGQNGRVSGIEYQPEQAARARANFASAPNVEIITGDGTRVAFDVADVIYVNAGATRPADAWLDRLADGGRLILPLTLDKSLSSDFPGITPGRVFRIERRGTDFSAACISSVAIFPCAGSRDRDSEFALSSALAKGGVERVTRLYRHNDIDEAHCWLRAPGWSLAYR
jgi:protein-L-isoaspartate(D-aspartate) O-methyltransferase